MNERYGGRKLPDLRKQEGPPSGVGPEKVNPPWGKGTKGQVVGELGTGCFSNRGAEEAQREKAWTEFVNNMNA